jgi:flagellar motility protein MotE (MotC chaperone)
MSFGFDRKWALMVAASVLIAGAGCRQAEAPSTKRARLIAAQEMEREKTIADLNARIEKLNQQIKEKDEQLAAYRRKIDASQNDGAQAASDRVNQVTASVLDDNARLRKEVESLRAQLARRANEPPASEGKPQP